MIEYVYTFNQLKEVKNLLELGKYVIMDVQTAGYIMRTFLSEDQIQSFVEKGTNELTNSQFSPMTYDQRVKDYFIHELVSQSNRKLGLETARSIVNNCEVYVQDYDYPIDFPKSNIFIMRTPTQTDFDTAKNTLIKILTSIGSNSSYNIDGVSIMVRGKRNFIDVEIENIHDKAWVGFDFR